MTFCLKTLKFLNDVEKGKHKSVPPPWSAMDQLEPEPGRLNSRSVSWQGDKSVIKSCTPGHLNMNFITPPPNYIFLTRTRPEIHWTLRYFPLRSALGENRYICVFGALINFLNFLSDGKGAFRGLLVCWLQKKVEHIEKSSIGRNSALVG